jgi:hypothetical protein
VAIKVPHLQPGRFGEELKQRFLREARASALIVHPNVCPVHDVSTDGEVPYLVMRYVEGGTLADLLKRRRKLLPQQRAASLARRIALGVAAAHAAGVVHRDLKPENVLWDAHREEVLVADFGLARLDDEDTLTSTGRVMGTYAYMSPEQARGKRDQVGPLSDIHALGAIFYEMLTGSAPFGRGHEALLRVVTQEPIKPTRYRPRLDPRLEAICLKAMSKNAADRHASALEFAAELEAYLSCPEPPATAVVVEDNPPPVSGDTACPGCAARLHIESNLAQRVVCPLCGHVLQALSAAPSAKPTRFSPSVARPPSDDRPSWWRVGVGLWIACFGWLLAVPLTLAAVGAAVALDHRHQPEIALGANNPTCPPWLWALATGGWAIVGAGRWASAGRAAGRVCRRHARTSSMLAFGSAAAVELTHFAMYTLQPETGRPDVRVWFIYYAILITLVLATLSELCHHRQLVWLAARVNSFPHRLVSTTRLLFLGALSLTVCDTTIELVRPGAATQGVVLASDAADKPDMKLLAARLSFGGAVVTGTAWLILAPYRNGRVAAAVVRHALDTH